jgi:DNA-binding MarR family transcriptional regulator
MDSFSPSGYDTSELKRCETDRRRNGPMVCGCAWRTGLSLPSMTRRLVIWASRAASSIYLVAVFREGTIRQTDLATLFNIDETTLSRNVMRMCRKGWLAPQPSADRRSHRIIVTEKGRDVIERAYPAWKVAQTEVLRRLGAPGAAALKKTRRVSDRAAHQRRARHRPDNTTG